MVMCVCVCLSVFMYVTLVNTIPQEGEPSGISYLTWMYHIEQMIPIVFGGGQNSFGVTRGQRVKNQTLDLKKGNSERSHTKNVEY